MRSVFLLAPILHVTARISLFDERQSVVTVPTFDFFEHRSNPYNVTGIACHISLDKDPKTQKCRVTAPPTLKNNSFTQSFQQTIMYAIFEEAYKCDIKTISQFFGKAHEMLPLLAEAGYPPSKTLVIFMGAMYDGAVGCPMKEPYVSTDLSVSDSPPPRNVNVALVGGSNTIQFLEAFGDGKPYAFNIVQETDPWNAIFLSFGYVFFNWCSIAIYFVAVIAVLKPSAEAYGKDTITVDLRNVIFWMAILGALSNAFYDNF